MARLLLRKWFPIAGMPCPKKSTVQHLVNAITRRRPSELKIAVRDLRANLKKWQPYFSGDFSFWYCHSALLLLAENYDVRMTTRQHAIDLLDLVGTLNHIGDFADEVDSDPEVEVDDFEVFARMAKDWNKWGPDMVKDADGNDDPCYEWCLLGMRGLRAEDVKAVKQE